MLLAVLDFVFLYLLPGVLIALAALDIGKSLGREEAADEAWSQRHKAVEVAFDKGYDAGYELGYDTAKDICIAALTGEGEPDFDETEDDE